jgi:hypothetical protein
LPIPLFKHVKHNCTVICIKTFFLS